MGGRAVRWTAIAASIALLLTTLAAGYLGGLYPQGSGSEPTRNVAAPYLVNGTPVAGTPASGTPVANVCDTVGHICRAVPIQRSAVACSIPTSSPQRRWM